jgi:hypothetical protein
MRNRDCIKTTVISTTVNIPDIYRGYIDMVTSYTYVYGEFLTFYFNPTNSRIDT